MRPAAHRATAFVGGKLAFDLRERSLFVVLVKIEINVVRRSRWRNRNDKAYDACMFADIESRQDVSPKL